jgi:hypothetical protein
VTISSVTIGGHVVRNVRAGVVRDGADMLLGLGVLVQVSPNVGDGFLFGGERHGPPAPFAGRVGLDPVGVAHFGFVSFGC